MFQSTAKRAPLYQLDAGIQKKIGGNEDILRFSASDIFNSGGNYRFGETIPGTGAIANRSFNFGLVAYRLTYTHNFGNKVLKGKRDRSTGAFIINPPFLIPYQIPGSCRIVPVLL